MGYQEKSLHFDRVRKIVTICRAGELGEKARIGTKGRHEWESDVERGDLYDGEEVFREFGKKRR